MKQFYIKTLCSVILFATIGIMPVFAQIHISTIADLQAIGSNQSGSYILDNDIDMTGVTFGQSDFTGTLDGNGFSIKNLNISHAGDRGGLFNNMTGATIQNLGLENITVDIGAGGWAGGIAGNASGSTITKCFVTGSVTSPNFAGGFVGHGDVTITESYSTATVTGNDHVGGLVGHMNSNSTILNSYVDANVTSTAFQVGGLVGWANGPSTLINNCYVMGTVTSASGFSGGIVGIADGGASAVTITNCIAKQSAMETTSPDIGKTFRIIANENGTTAVFTNNYGLDTMGITDPHRVGWDDDVAGKDGGNITAVAFVDTSFYSTNLANWDFSSIWIMEAAKPELIWVHNAALSVDTALKSTIKVYTANGSIHIRGAEKGTQVFVYDITGKKLANKILDGSNTSLTQKSGIRIVRIKTANALEIFKVIN